MARRAKTNRAFAAVLVFACALAVPSVTTASFPGRNGPFVVSLTKPMADCGRYLARVPWRGGKFTPITDRAECDPDRGGESPATQSLEFPEAAPDGRSLLARRYFSGVGRPAFVTLEPGGTNLRPLTIPAEVGPFGAPSFAPDGRRFAIKGWGWLNGRDRAPLWEVRLNESSARMIRRAPVCAPGEACTSFANPRWSPEGKLLAVEAMTYVYEPDQRAAASGTSASGIWLMRAKDGKLVRQLTRDKALWSGSAYRTDVDWSPDGKNIVYRTSYQLREMEGGASGGNIYVVSRDGRHRRTLVHRHDIAESQPVWSPDGRWIAWVSLEFAGEGWTSWDFQVRPSLWIVRSGGGTPRKIQDLPRPYVNEGQWGAPQLTWLPRPE